MLLLKERLIQRRHALNMSQSELALKAGVSERTIVSYEAGDGQPTFRSLQKIADALDIKASYLTDEAVSLASLAEKPTAYETTAAIALEVLPTAFLREMVKVLSSLVPHRRGSERTRLLQALMTATQELDQRPEVPVNSYEVSFEDKRAIELAEADVDREIQESKPKPPAGGHSGGSVLPSPGTSSATKAKHP